MVWVKVNESIPGCGIFPYSNWSPVHPGYYKVLGVKYTIGGDKIINLENICLISPITEYNISAMYDSLLQTPKWYDKILITIQKFIYR